MPKVSRLKQSGAIKAQPWTPYNGALSELKMMFLCVHLKNSNATALVIVLLIMKLLLLVTTGQTLSYGKIVFTISKGLALG